MTFIRDSLQEYRELYLPMRRSFSGWARGPLSLMLLVMLLLAMFCLMLHYGWFNPALERPLALRYLHFGEACRLSIPLTAFIAWIGIALANLRHAESTGLKLSSAQGFLLLLHSGLWPLLCGLLMTALTLGALLLLSNYNAAHGWLGENDSWAYMLEHLRRELQLELLTLPSHYLHFSGLTVIGMAVASLNRQASVLWLVCGLLNLQLLMDIAACFQHANVYALYWMDTLYRPGVLLLGFTLLVAILIHMADNERIFLPVAGLLAGIRSADLLFSFSSYGSFHTAQYDSYLKPLANISWHLNIPFRFPFIGSQPGDYNPAFGFSASLGEGQLLAIYDQFELGLHSGPEAYPLAWLGNLLWLTLIILACLHRLHSSSRSRTR